MAGFGFWVVWFLSLFLAVCLWLCFVLFLVPFLLLLRSLVLFSSLGFSVLLFRSWSLSLCRGFPGSVRSVPSKKKKKKISGSCIFMTPHKPGRFEGASLGWDLTSQDRCRALASPRVSENDPTLSHGSMANIDNNYPDRAFL